MPNAVLEPVNPIDNHGRRLWTGRWLPLDQSPGASVLLLRGYAEHLGRDERVAAALTAWLDSHAGGNRGGFGRGEGER